MKRLIGSITLLAILAIGRAASAAEATGWITHLFDDSDRFLLDDGRVFGVSEDINFASLKDGIRVTIHFDTYGRDRIATDIELAPLATRRLSAPHSQTSRPCDRSRNAKLVGELSSPLRAVC